MARDEAIIGVWRDKLGAAVGERMRALGAAASAADVAQRRQAQMNLLGRCVQQAYDTSPDIFRGWPAAERLAARIVATVEGEP